MENFIAVVGNDGSTLTKYQDFAVEADADSHVATYGGFVVANPGGNTSYWVVDAEAETVTNNQDQADADALARSWANLRAERDILLGSSDWTQGADSPLDNKAEWATYRQELRDFPESADPTDPTWPTPPA